MEFAYSPDKGVNNTEIKALAVCPLRKKVKIYMDTLHRARYNARTELKRWANDAVTFFK